MKLPVARCSVAVKNHAIRKSNKILYLYIYKYKYIFEMGKGKNRTATLQRATAKRCRNDNFYLQMRIG